ncbi:MAG: alpha/beta fold hydrolase [Planctomycetota bacterium]
MYLSMSLILGFLILAHAPFLSAGEPQKIDDGGMVFKEAGPGAPEDIDFTSTLDGTVQKYVRILPPGYKVGDQRDALICLHGHGSDRWQYIKLPRGETKGARDTAAKYGMILVSPDYRTNSWMGPKGEADVLQIISDLRSKQGVKRIFLTGGSMGGTSVLIFTILHPELIAGVASLNGMANMVEYDKFSEAIVPSYGGTKAEKPDEYKKRSAELFPHKFTMPVAITAGGKDTAVPPQSVLRLGDALKKINQHVLVINRETTGHSTNYEDTVAAIEFVIKAAAPWNAARKK